MTLGGRRRGWLWPCHSHLRPSPRKPPAETRNTTVNGRKDSARLHPLPVTEETEDTRLAVHGGNPVRRAPWPTYEKGAVFVHPEDEDAALRAIRSHLYFRYDYRSHQDTECGRFEEELRRYFGSKHALAVSSGTTALVLAIMA